MECTANDLRRVMIEFSGGSDQRYRHPFNRRFIYSAGIQAMADAAGAYWLIDMVALEMAPVYAAAWQKEETSIGFVKLTVPEKGVEGKARVELSLVDDAPAAVVHELDFTTFPPGAWTFYLGTDMIGEDQYITTMYLAEEH